MIKVSILYPNKPGTKFDMAYYCDRHIPMVRTMLGAALKGVAVEQGISAAAPGSPAPYIAVGHLLFDSLETFQASIAPHSEALKKDVPKYTNSEPIFQIGQIKL